MPIFVVHRHLGMLYGDSKGWDSLLALPRDSLIQGSRDGWQVSADRRTDGERRFGRVRVVSCHRRTLACKTSDFKRWTCGRIEATRGATLQAFPAEADDRLSTVTYSKTDHGPVQSLEEAADLRGLPPRAIIKTIVVRRSEDDHVFVLVPGDRVIDWAKLRVVLGERRLSMPSADEAFAVTGYVRGTITPFASKTPLSVVADALVPTMVVSIGAGEHGRSLMMEGSDLVEVLNASVADVTKERSPTTR